MLEVPGHESEEQCHITATRKVLVSTAMYTWTDMDNRSKEKCLLSRMAQKNHVLENLISPREFVFLLGHKSRKKQNKYFFQNFLAPYAPP